MTVTQPVLWADFPDPDVIRVGGTYYMITTTMHLFPGGQILKSGDLLHWEHCGYVFDTLGDSPAQRLDGGNCYGKGMWAATLRYHNGEYHVVFTCNDTHRSCHYTANAPQGPWLRHEMRGFFYDPSLLFDSDGRVYIAHGNHEIYITEMDADLSGPKENGFHRLVLSDAPTMRVGFEGTHFYRIGGRYTLFCIHWPNDGFARRTEVCYTASSLEDAFTGGTIVDDDLGFFNMGVAQGGAVETPDGQWYLMLFQDHGAVGRMPILVPMTWTDGFPSVERIPREITAETPGAPEHLPMPLYASDSLRSKPLNPLWQWNHEPAEALISITAQGLRLTAGRVVNQLDQAQNTLTQRTFGPACEATVTVDASELNPGDYAGLCALIGCFCQLAITRDWDGWYLSLISKEAQPAAYAIQPSSEPVVERVRLRWNRPQVTLKACFDFQDLADTVSFFYEENGIWQPIGRPHALVYRLDFFVGCRIGLFCYATQKPSGSAVFADFQYEIKQSALPRR